jgi:hypothetical protein
MSTVNERDVLLYVKSEDVIRMVLPPDAQDEALRAYRAHGYCTAPLGSLRGLPIAPGPGAGYFGNKPIRDKEIPEGEQEVIQRVLAAAHHQGRDLHIVDVGKESALRRLIEEHLHKIRKYPVLVRPDGRRLEGIESVREEELQRFLSE